MKYQDEFRKEYFEKLKKEGYELNEQVFVQIEKDLYIEWLETKLQNTSPNSDYAVQALPSPKLPSFRDVLDETDNKIGTISHEWAKGIYDAIKKLGNFA